MTTARKTLTFALMDPPFESARSTTGLRLVDAALRRGHDVNVFAYEGAVSLAFAGQKPHANSVHGTSVEEEDHPLTRDWIASLLEAARAGGRRLDWVNCGLCVDERGVNESIAGPRRGSPADLARMIEESDNTLVIPTGD
jgi:tRNA 2-thiouridine synthesizing protein D